MKTSSASSVLRVASLIVALAAAVSTDAPAQRLPAIAAGSREGSSADPSPASPSFGSSDVESIHLYVGQAHVLNDARIKRIAVGNGRVLQATALDDRQVLVIPENPGQSTLHLWDRNGRQKHYVINVVTADANRLQTEIRAMVGSDGNVRTRIVGDKVIVEGSNLSEEQNQRLGEVAKRYPQIVNLVSRVGLERMIAMDVRMVEIRRELMQNIGIKWDDRMQGPTFGILGDLKRSDAFKPGGVAASVDGLAVRARSGLASTFGIASSISSMINLLVQNGDAVVLAEPRLSCRSGGNARFVAGGELPVPQSSSLGAMSVSYKEYGVKFEISPVASESGIISANIATEISSINGEVTVRDVPALTKRRAETEVNLRENETLVIAGLVTDETSSSVDRVAGLGQLPILGKLFRSRLFRDRQSDLVVFITPRFVEPGPAADAPDVFQQPAFELLERGRSEQQRIRTID
ncbi:MAG: pilus assembly protein N-terminal domain-containing protein [Burkholderiaceae bacterium]